MFHCFWTKHSRTTAKHKDMQILLRPPLLHLPWDAKSYLSSRLHKQEILHLVLIPPRSNESPLALCPPHNYFHNPQLVFLCYRFIFPLLLVSGIFSSGVTSPHPSRYPNHKPFHRTAPSLQCSPEMTDTVHSFNRVWGPNPLFPHSAGKNTFTFWEDDITYSTSPLHKRVSMTSWVG